MENILSCQCRAHGKFLNIFNKFMFTKVQILFITQQRNYL